MEETTLATYKRESTLWKNASAFYKAHDWVTMECKFFDYSEERNATEFRFFDKCGNDVTEKVVAERFYDRYAIVLTNATNTNQKVLTFRTIDEANNQFKSIINDKVFGNFKRA